MKELIMSHRRRILSLALVSLVLSPAAFAQQTPQPPPAPAPPPETAPEGPGYRARALPTDTFKPSEQVSEDYPVVFPADI